MSSEQKVEQVSSPKAMSIGALALALFSSACCWGPLLVVALGAPLAGVGAFFEPLRWPMGILCFSFLAFAFYSTYRKPVCDDATGCPNPKATRRRKLMLWMTAVLSIAFFMLPKFMGMTTNVGISHAAVDKKLSTRFVLKGLTCGGCEGHVREALESLPEIVSAQPSYAQGTLVVFWSDTPHNALVEKTIEEIGYQVQVVQQRGNEEKIVE